MLSGDFNPRPFAFAMQKRGIVAAVTTFFAFFSLKHLRCKQKSSYLGSVNPRIGYPGKFPARGKPLSTLPIKKQASQEALFFIADSTSFRTYVYEKILSPPLAPYQINPLSLQSDEIPKQAIGKDYLHGINRFLHFEFPTFSYWRSNCWPSFFCSKTTLNTYAYVNFIEKPQPHLHQRLLA